MIRELRENIVHGTKEYPYDQYTMESYRHPFQIPAHWHDEFEIIYVQQGRLNVKIESNEFLASAQDIFFVNPRELHFMAADDPNTVYSTLLFPLEFVSFQTNDVLETQLMAPLRGNTISLPTMLTNPTAREKIIPLLEGIINVNQGNVHNEHYDISLVGTDLATRIQLLSIFQILFSEREFYNSSKRSSTELPREMLSFIQENYTDRLTLSMMAEEFHLSEKYISRYFNEHFHMPFSGYIVHLRVTRGKQLLESTNDSVTDIALQCGFPNVSYFIRSFKSAYDMSPLKYRKKHTGSN